MKASQLLVGGPAAPGRLLLQRAERSQLALPVDDLLGRSTPSARISSASRSASQTKKPSASMPSP
jgi:hypothetical protein